MTVCRFAELSVGFEHRYSYFLQLVRDYTVKDSTPSESIRVTDREIAEEKAHVEDGASRHPALLEATALWRRFCHRLPSHDAFLLHAACLSVNGRGIAFTAPSGVGKSTHVSLWRELLGDRCTVVNGDKPILRRGADGRFWGYGTPLCGKEGWHANTSVPLSALFFLERGEEDRVTPITASEAFPALYTAALAPESQKELSLLLPLLSGLLSSVSLFRLTCTPRQSAARLAIQAVFTEDLIL